MKIFSKIAQLLFFASLVICGGCAKKSEQVRPPTPVVSAPVVAMDVPLYVESIGCCVASEAVDIVPQVSGQILSVNFEQGQDVKAGDSLFSIDKRPYAANLKKAEAQLGMARAKMKIDAAQLERSKALLPQNYISQQQYEAYEAQVEQDNTSIEAALAQVEQARVDLEHCDVTSPIDGIAGCYLVDAGNIVGAMAINRPLVTVQKVDPLYVEFSLSENNFNDLQKYFTLSNQSLKVEVAAISNEGVSGEATLTFINNSISRKAGSIKLRALMRNPDRKFWPGYSVRTKVFLSTLTGAVLVPSEAIKLGQRGHYVFVIKEDKSVELRMIEIGQTHEDMIVVKQGLQAGEAVVQRGQLMLAPGMKVVELPDNHGNLFKQDLEKNKKIAEKNPTTK